MAPHFHLDLATWHWGRPGKRSAIRLLLAVALLTASLLTPAQAEGTPRAAGAAAHVLIVLSGDEPPYQAARAEIEKRLADGGLKVATLLLDELVKDGGAAGAKPGIDIFLAVGTKAAVLLHEHVKPPARMIYCMVAAPESLGLLTGQPVWGVSTDVPLESQIKLISQALPGVRNIGMLYRADQPKSAALMKSLQQALPKDWKLEAVAMNEQPSVAAGLEALFDKARKIDVVWTAPDSAVYDSATVRALLLASIRKGKPVFGFSPAFVKAGALLGIGIDPRREGEQAAELVLAAQALTHSPSPTSQSDGGGSTGFQPVAPNAGLKPVPPEFKPRVVSPRFLVAVNLIVAEQIGVQLPEAVIQAADMVFKPDGEGAGRP